MHATSDPGWLPAVLAWLLDWIGVPATMMWLWLRWILGGPVLERPDSLTLDDRKAALEGTLAGSALAVLVFLIHYALKTPAPAQVLPGTLSDSVQNVRAGAGMLWVVIAGFACGMLPRAVRHAVRNVTFLKWVRSFVLAVWLASAIGVFSLLAYCESRDAHAPLLAAFSGLAAGYLMAPLLIRFLQAIKLYQ